MEWIKGVLALLFAAWLFAISPLLLLFACIVLLLWNKKTLAVLTGLFFLFKKSKEKETGQ